MASLLRPCFVLFAFFTLVTGVIYPSLVTGIAQLVFPHQANGSLIEKDGRVVGSELVGQSFVEPKYFWGRRSATSPAYNGAASAGSNLGPLHPALAASVQARVSELRSADPGSTGPVPIDLVTASASGLDPHLSPAAALYQVPRVARARSLPEGELQGLVEAHTEHSLLGEDVVNVLKLNLALDQGDGRAPGQ